MIRVWNYNCTRTRTFRGVRFLAILNEKQKLLYFGEIKKSSGQLNSPSKNYENILFTKDPEVLLRIASADWVYRKKKNRGKSMVKFKKEIEEKISKRPLSIEKSQKKPSNWVNKELSFDNFEEQM